MSASLFVPCVQYVPFVHMVFYEVYLLSLDCSPYSGQRLCSSASGPQYWVGGGVGSTLCACPYFSYPKLLNGMKFDISVCFVSFANYVSCFDGNVSVFAQAPPCYKVRKLVLRK